MIREPRILVAGAGALGSVVGGLLFAAGRAVTLLGRRAHLDAVRCDGLLVDGLFGTRRIAGIACATDVRELRGRFDAILLTVKAYDTAPMAAAVADRLADDGVLVSMQNGLGNVEAASAAVGASRLLAARVIFGAEILAPGHTRVTVMADPVLVGSPDPGDARRVALARELATMLDAAGVPARATGDIATALWTKVLYNAALNPLGALLDTTYGALAANADTRAVMDAIIEEAFAVARAAGVTLPWATAAAYREEFYGRLVPSTAGHRSSMLQDLRRGRRTEIDAINGWVAARGEALGVPTPANALLTRIVRARTEAACSR
ncbi:MAG TPA: 2-dehydropantoate 2-reductase [Candidatus Binatia bacterium]|jgi:2-dehydropantoate 2-reductase|nr:2-dehydropantoate 2-reductase [Candidatus Binatia bacterium]